MVNSNGLSVVVQPPSYSPLVAADVAVVHLHSIFMLLKRRFQRGESTGKRVVCFVAAVEDKGQLLLLLAVFSCSTWMEALFARLDKVV